MKRNLKTKVISAAISLVMLAGAAAPFTALAAEDGSAPSNLIMVGRDKTWTVSWVNPTGREMSKIEILKADGTVLASSESESNPLSLEQGASNWYKYSEKSGGRYKCFLNITFADGEVYKEACATNYMSDGGMNNSVNAPNDNQKIAGWMGAVNTAPFTKYEMSTDTVHGGNASLHIINNLSSAIAGTYQRLLPNMTETIESGGQYRFVYWEKAVNTKGYSLHYADAFVDTNDSNSEWTQRVLEFTGNENSKSVFFKFERQTDTYIDDCALYKIGEDGSVISDNLLENGDFEQCDYTAPSELSNISYSLNGDNAVVNWTNPSDSDYAYAKIYNDKGTCIDIVQKADVSVELADSIGKSYIFKSVDSNGNESAGIEVALLKTNIAPANFMAVGRHNSLSVSWINPNLDNITKISVYDKDNNLLKSSQNAEDGISIEASAHNYFTLSAANGTKNIYKIEIEYANGEVFRGETASNILKDMGAMLWSAPKEPQPPTGWKGSASGVPYTKYDVQTDVVHSGNAALLVRNNLPQETALSNVFQRLGAEVSGSLTNGKQYAFSYWRKTVDAGRYKVYCGPYEKYSEIAGTSDWKKQEFTFTMAADRDVRFQFEYGAKAIYIDDCALYELDENKNPVGDNLLANGGFEACDVTIPAEVSDAHYEVTKGTGTITWTMPEGVNEVRVYENYCGHSNLRAVAYKENTITIDAGCADEYVIKTVSDSGIESAGITVAKFEQLDDYEFSGFGIFDANGNEAQYVDAGMTYTVKANIKNNLMGEAFKPCIAAAVYKIDLDGAESLYGIYYFDKQIAPSQTDELTIDVQIPNDYDNLYKIKAFLWEGASSMRPMGIPNTVE